jgi:hypothetical protein
MDEENHDMAMTSESWDQIDCSVTSWPKKCFAIEVISGASIGTLMIQSIIYSKQNENLPILNQILHDTG